MQGFKFKDTDTLRAALLGEIVPAQRAAKPVSFCREGTATWIIPNGVSKPVRRALVAAGAGLGVNYISDITIFRFHC